MRKRKLKIGVIILTILTLIFYFYILPFDYKVSFKTQHSPWGTYHFMENNFDIEELLISNDNHFEFKIKLTEEESKQYDLEWEAKALNSEITQLTIYAKFKKDRFEEKIKLILKKSPYVNRILGNITNLRSKLQNEINNYSYGSIQKDTLNEILCLCTKIDSKIKNKANEMNRSIDYLASYLPPGRKEYPLLYINALNFKKQTISFDFCFPILEEKPVVIDNSDVFIAKKPSILGFSQTFYGNYSRTHQGWFKAIQRLGFLNEKIEFPILEIFYDSPFSGADDTKWKSNLYFLTKKY